MIDTTPVVEALSVIDKQSATINASLAILIIKMYFDNKKSSDKHSSELGDIKKEVATLKEKVSRSERDIDTLESSYNQTNTELRYFLKYQDGRITKSTM